MSFTLPTSWGELTEAQLLHVLEVLFIYRNDEDALAKIVDVHEGFFEVVKRPEKFNVKEDE